MFLLPYSLLCFQQLSLVLSNVSVHFKALAVLFISLASCFAGFFSTKFLLQCQRFRANTCDSSTGNTMTEFTTEINQYPSLCFEGA